MTVPDFLHVDFLVGDHSPPEVTAGARFSDQRGLIVGVGGIQNFCMPENEVQNGDVVEALLDIVLSWFFFQTMIFGTSLDQGLFR